MDQTAMPSPLPSGNDPNLLPQVQGWNWGAFFLNWIWAFAHGLPAWGVIVLVVSLIPIVNIASLGLTIYLGIRGSELAWRNRPFQSLQQFRETERIWAWWGVGVFILSLMLATAIVVAILIPVFMRALHTGRLV
jgi:hypothetical protein